jgi:3-methyl-2-oxobutanoate hydroxymethyltransferase
MPRIFDFGGRDVERSQTIAGLRGLKGASLQAAQVTAETAEEAAAAEAAGIEMAVCRAANVGLVREGSQRLFVTAALGFAEAVTADEILRTAFSAITGGADAVLTSRGSETVRSLADEQIPVVGHLGFVPRKSTWVGGVRAVGKTATEALQLWDRFRRLEDAGGRCHVIETTTRSGIAVRNFNWPRRPRATWSSPRREARGAIELI